jgi:putative oxidoreductase
MKVLSDFVLRLLTRPLMTRWSPVPLRLIVGYGFIQHGFAKLSRGPGMFAAILQGMGVPTPHVMAWLTILTELLGGLAVLLGAFVRIVSVPMTAVLLVAMFKVHLQYGFSSIKLLAVTATGAKFGPVGYEVILLYVACLAALVIGGSGPFAIDGLVRRRFEARTSTSRHPRWAGRCSGPVMSSWSATRTLATSGVRVHRAAESSRCPYLRRGGRVRHVDSKSRVPARKDGPA